MTIPYIVCSPAYNDISSGVKTLHLLCDMLNKSGQEAYIQLYGEPKINPANPLLRTPLAPPTLSKEPIIVYPDHVTGNPLGAKNVVRYLLARPGQYAPYKTEPTDKIWCHSASVAKEMGHDRVLRIPCTDTNIFYPPKIDLEEDMMRQGSCYYAYKYDRIHGNSLLDITKDSVRLQGAPHELAEILRKSAVCYVYEPSNIIFDATLCGCVVILVRTNYFNDLPTQGDWKFNGVRWSDAPKTPLNKDEPLFWWRDVKTEHVAAVEESRKQLARFVRETQC